MTKAMGCGVAAIIALLVALALYAGVMGKYNKLVDLDEGVAAGWAQVETVLQRRYDLIPQSCEHGEGLRCSREGCLYRGHAAAQPVGRCQDHRREGGSRQWDGKCDWALAAGG